MYKQNWKYHESIVDLTDTTYQIGLFTNILLKGYSIIGSGSGFTVNLGSDSLGKSHNLGVSSRVSRIHFGFGFIVNPDPDPIIT